MKGETGQSDRFYDMHIIICDVFKLIRNDRLFFQLQYVIEQIYQNIIDGFL